MKFRRDERQEPEINLIPLIDVLLMTLIFLLVTTSFSKESSLKIKLPSASADAKAQSNTLRVTIDAKGLYYIADRQLLRGDVDTLKRAMRDAAGAHRDPVVVVYADGRTPHAAVIRVMDAARQLGFTHLTFATHQADAKTPP